MMKIAIRSFHATRKIRDKRLDTNKKISSMYGVAVLIGSLPLGLCAALGYVNFKK